VTIITNNGISIDPGVPASSAAFDRTNNVEQVVWKNVPAGSVTVTVAAHKVTLGPQNFALVIRVQ
jgi:hypothetical protein